MTNERGKTTMGDTAKTHLVDCFVSMKYGRREEIHGKFLDKGNHREEDSITLLSLTRKKFYKKNDQRIDNDFISGEPDLFDGPEIRKAEEIIDTKTSWSAHTFWRSKMKPLDKSYYWQMMGYMWLTGAKSATVAFCLVNGTLEAIVDEKRKAGYRYGPDPDSNPEYKKECEQIEINHIFDIEAFKREYPFYQFDVNNWAYDIPMNERIFTHTVQRDDSEIKAIENRVIEARDWMTKNLFNG